MQQFRVIQRNGDGDIEKTIMVSDIFSGNSQFDQDFRESHYNELMELNEMFHLEDYDHVPDIEFQRREEKDGEWSDWKFYSDPVDDYYNL